MDTRKYKKIARLLVFLIFVLLVLVLFVLPSFRKNDAGDVSYGKNEEGVSTENAIFDASIFGNGKFIQDYLNPTESERMAAIIRYGAEHVKFKEAGLHVVGIDDVEDRLFTDVWPSTEFTSKIVEPTDLDIYLIEHGKTYVIINVADVSEKDLKRYVRLIKDEFSEELFSRHSETLYRAKNEGNLVVDVKFYEDKNRGIIKYSY